MTLSEYLIQLHDQMPTTLIEAGPYIIVAAICILLRRDFMKILSAVERMPAAAWFEKVDEHLEKLTQLASQSGEFRVRVDDSLSHGRAKMDKLDERIRHLEMKGH